MKNFKDIVKQDIANVFLNTDEFADLHTIKFDGETYKDIPVVIENLMQSERDALRSDYMQGIYSVTAKAYFSADDTKGKIPEQGKYFEIDDGTAIGKTFFQRYHVASVENNMGMVCVDLEAFDE